MARWVRRNIIESVYLVNQIVVPVAGSRERSCSVELGFRLVIKSIVVKCLSIQLREIKEWRTDVSNDVEMRRLQTLLLYITFFNSCESCAGIAKRTDMQARRIVIKARSKPIQKNTDYLQNATQCNASESCDEDLCS
jgi:hypothetical protein